MTIHFFLQSRDFGGAEKFAKDLLLELSTLKTEVYFYTSNPILLKELSKQKQVHLIKIPIYLDFAGNGRGLIKSMLLSPLAFIFYLQTLRQISQKTGEQKILCSGFSEKIMVAPLAHLCGVPVFFIEYGPLEPIFTKLWGIPKLLYFFAKKYNTKTIVSSLKTKKALAHIFEAQKLTLIRCGSPDPLLSQKHSSGQKKHLVSIISRLEEGKGQDLAIQAWILAKKPPNACLQIIGRGQENFEKKLKSLAANDPSIQFLSYVENTEKIMQESSMIMCPSVWELEGFGLVVTEAMAYGKAIIAFDRAPYNELLTHQKNALLVKKNDVKDLARAIEKVVANQTLKEKLGKQARKDFLQNYQISQSAQNYLRVLQS